MSGVGMNIYGDQVVRNFLIYRCARYAESLNSCRHCRGRCYEFMNFVSTIIIISQNTEKSWLITRE